MPTRVAHSQRDTFLWKVRSRATAAVLAAAVSLGAPGFGDSLALLAQAPTSFRGARSLAGVAGEALYDYRLDAGDTVRVGAFSFRAYDAEALLSGGDRHVDIAGEFDGGGRASGPWRFDFGALTAADVVEVRDLRYHLAVDGERRRTVGTFVDGEAEGTWTTVVERIRRSDPVDTLFSSRISYVSGVPQQTVQLESAETSVLGLVTRDGFAEDAWELFDARGTTETWRFHGGLLREVASGGAPVPVFDDREGVDTFHVALDEDYLRLLGEWQYMRGRDGGRARRGIGRLLGLNARAYAEVDAATEALGLAGGRPGIRVAVPAATLSPRAAARLARISASLVRFGVEADALLGDPRLRRVAAADEEVAFLRAAAAALRDDFLAPARRLDTAYHVGLLRSLPLAEYLSALWPSGTIDGAVDVDFDGPAGPRRRTWNPAPDTRFDVASAGASAVESLVGYAVEGLADIRARLAERIDAAGVADPTLAGEGSRIEATYARLDSLIGAQPRRLVREVGLGHVRRAAEIAINDYRGLDVLGRQGRVARLNACLDDLYSLAVTLRNVPVYNARVEDAYTDEVWNNIIATVMTERVKKRITEAYRERLVPYYLQRVRDELSCSNAAAIDAGLTAVYERVLALRDADTEALEDELRGVRQPERVLTLLQVTPVN